MPDRITLTKTCYMPLNGQWQVVYSGSVIDVPSATPYLPVAPSPQIGTGTVTVDGKPRGHANIRTAR